MNKHNNRRAQDTVERIIRAVFGIMHDDKKPISKITVREVCERADINRSTFYAHYKDVYDVGESVERHMAEMGKESILTGWERGNSMRAGLESMFAFFKEYREFYMLFLSESLEPSVIMLMVDQFREQLDSMNGEELGYEIDGELEYHQAFLIAGMSALVFRWLKSGCKETPAQLYEILEREYKNNSLLFNEW